MGTGYHLVRRVASPDNDGGVEGWGLTVVSPAVWGILPMMGGDECGSSGHESLDASYYSCKRVN